MQPTPGRDTKRSRRHLASEARSTIIGPPWSSLNYVELAAQLLSFIPRRQDFINRKVETLRFVDSGTLLRHVSVDFTVPQDPKSDEHLEAASSARLVPLTLLRKGKLRNFDIKDAQGHAIPILTSDEYRRLATAMLIVQAQALLRGRPLAKELAEAIGRMVAQRDPDKGTQEAETFRKPDTSHQAGTDGQEIERQRQILTADRTFSWLLSLGHSYILCVLVTEAAGRRLVVKYEYEVSADLGHPSARLPPGLRLRSWRRRIGTGLSLSALRVRVRVKFEGRVYHVEISPPEDIFCEEADLLTATREILDSDRCVRRAHLRAEAIHPDEEGYLDLRLRLLPDGLLPAALFVGLLTVLMLVGALALFNLAAQALPGGSGILVAIPGVIGAYLFRPGEHRLVRRLGWGTRLLIGVLVVDSLMAAGLLTVRLGTGVGAWGVSLASGSKPILWIGLAGIAVGVFGLLAAASGAAWRSVWPGRRSGRL